MLTNLTPSNQKPPSSWEFRHDKLPYRKGYNWSSSEYGYPRTLYTCFSQPAKTPKSPEASPRGPAAPAATAWTIPLSNLSVADAKAPTKDYFSSTSVWEEIPVGDSTLGPAAQPVTSLPEKLECSVVIADGTRSNQGMFHHFLTTEFNLHDKQQPPRRTYKWKRLDTSGTMGRMLALVNMSEAYTIKDESKVEEIIKSILPPTGWGGTEDWVKRIIQALLNAKCISKVKSRDTVESIWTEMKAKSQKFLERVQADERPIYGNLPAFKFRAGRWMPPVPPKEKPLVK